jgi:hypothetical protein
MIDLLDIAAIAGTLLLAVGLALIWLPLAPVVIGALLLAYAVLAARRPTPEGGE